MNFLCKLGFHKRSGCYCLRCTEILHRWSKDGVECLVCGFNPSKLKAEKAKNEARAAEAKREAVLKARLEALKLYAIRGPEPEEPEERESVPLAETKELRKFRKEMEELRRFRF
jgi:hypothetical protein